MTNSHAVVVKIALALLLSIGVAPSVAAQGVGGIGGAIFDESGGVLPGVVVTLSNPGTIGGNQTTTSDDRGAYQFTRLVPGRYSVRADLPGFRPALQENVVVNADFTARVDLKLAVGPVDEGIIVKGEAPLLDTTSALKQTVLPADVLQALPIRSDVWAIARMVPSISLNAVDVGGSESFLQSRAIAHGAIHENAFMVDGLDLTSASNSGTNALLYPDPYLFQEVNFQVGNASAEVSQGGVIFNMITKTGTNVFHGGGTFSGSNGQMSSANYSPELRAQLLAAVPAKVLAANPNIAPGANINHIYDTGGWMTGPIVRDKLWFLGTARTQVLNQFVLGSYNPDGTLVVDDNVMWNVATKVSWQMSRKSQLSYFFNQQYKLIRARSGGGLFAETAARNYNAKYPYLHQVKWMSVLSSKLVVDVSGSVMNSDDPMDPQPSVKQGDISRFDSVTNTYTVALPTYSSPWYGRGTILTSASYFNGAHSLKFGYQLNQSWWRTFASSTSDMRAVYRNGVPDSVNTYNTPTGTTTYTRNQSVYAQDKWTPLRRLTLNLGVRFERYYGWQPATCQPKTQFVAEQCFPDINGAPDFFDVSPRFSAILDLFGQGRTVLKLAANRYEVPLASIISARINPLTVKSDTRSWVDANGDLIPQLTELGPSTGFNFGLTNRYADDLKRPRANEYSLELQHQLPSNIVASVAYIRRERRQDIGSRNVAVPMSSYTPLQVTEVTSGRQVTVYNQALALRNRFDVLWDNMTEMDSDYNGLDMTFEKRLTAGWMVMSGASIGKTVGDIYQPTTGATSADFNDPNFGFRRGPINDDVPYTLRATGLYMLPHEVRVSATVQRSAGFPELTTVLIGRDTVVLTQVTQTVTVEPRGATRLPAVNQLDVSVAKGFRRGTLSVKPRIDFFNLANSATILGRITQLGPTYNRVSSIQRGRMIKLGVDFDF